MAKKFGKRGNPLGAKGKADIVGRELERIRKKHGILKPELVVEESRSKNAPLHGEFEWDNTVAGELWRVHHARNIIRDVTISGVQNVANQTAAYVNISAPSPDEVEERQYESIEKVLADPVQRAELVQRALEKLVRVQHEFRHLRELANVWSAIDIAIETGVV